MEAAQGMHCFCFHCPSTLGFQLLGKFLSPLTPQPCKRWAVASWFLILSARVFQLRTTLTLNSEIDFIPHLLWLFDMSKFGSVAFVVTVTEGSWIVTC